MQSVTVQSVHWREANFVGILSSMCWTSPAGAGVLADSFCSTETEQRGSREWSACVHGGDPVFSQWHARACPIVRQAILSRFVLVKPCSSPISFQSPIPDYWLDLRFQDRLSSVFTHCSPTLSLCSAVQLCPVGSC
jgi:hypothetical protein